MIKKYVIAIISFYVVLYFLAATKLITIGSSQNTWGIYVPIFFCISIIFFNVKQYSFIQILNSLCFAFILYAILFIFIEESRLSNGGLYGLGAIMYAFYAILITVIANLIGWIRKDKKSN